MLDGKDISKMNAEELRNVRRHDINMVFQSFALFPHKTILENTEFGLELRGVPKAERQEAAEKALDNAGLLAFKDQYPNQLSGGMQQRVGLARALANKPKILLMDEPLSALDKKLREEMQIELRQLHDALNMTTVYVTHDQKEALTMSDRITVINDGKLMQLGTPNEIYKNPSNAFIADFIGESSLLPVSVNKSQISFGPETIKTSSPPAQDGKFLLVVRPEKTFVATDKQEGVNYFSGVLLDSIFQGESQLLVVKLAPLEGEEQTLRVRVPNGSITQEALPAVGETVTIGLKVADSYLVS